MRSFQNFETKYLTSLVLILQKYNLVEILFNYEK